MEKPQYYLWKQDEEIKILKEQIKQQQDVIEKYGKQIERMNGLLEKLLRGE